MWSDLNLYIYICLLPTVFSLFIFKRKIKVFHPFRCLAEIFVHIFKILNLAIRLLPYYYSKSYIFHIKQNHSPYFLLKVFEENLISVTSMFPALIK
jgi:hypothetical protein